MVADPGPGVPIPTLTWGYVVAAVAFPVRAGSPRFSRVSGWHRLQAAHGGSLCQYVPSFGPGAPPACSTRRSLSATACRWSVTPTPRTVPRRPGPQDPGLAV